MKTALYVARDRDGTLFLYENEPERDMEDDQWCPGSINDDFIRLDPEEFTEEEISWEDPPMLVKLTKG